MSDRPDETPAARDADELNDAVAGLGETDEDRLEAVTQHNASLEERLPTDDDLPRTHGSADGSPQQG